jgi:hypothetical protein
MSSYPRKGGELPRHLCEHVLQEVSLLALLHFLLRDGILQIYVSATGIIYNFFLRLYTGGVEVKT